MKSGNVDGVSLSLSAAPSLNAANINDAARVVRMGGAAKEGGKEGRRGEREIEDLLVARILAP